ncbi:hypothetical protein [Vibrio atypicus]|uniref:hypothetical protein n=1 Tax=Vibrio atypicus TaxID=558271 RepID=UPI0013A5585D|nr:hypothetical protein [Vibrio atypicus]
MLNLHQDPLSGDGAYDTRYCHDETRFKRPVWLIPPESELRLGKMVSLRHLAFVNNVLIKLTELA